jgi:uncharacterized membrane protein
VVVVVLSPSTVMAALEIRPSSSPAAVAVVAALIALASVAAAAAAGEVFFQEKFDGKKKTPGPHPCLHDP